MPFQIRRYCKVIVSREYYSQTFTYTCIFNLSFIQSARLYYIIPTLILLLCKISYLAFPLNSIVVHYYNTCTHVAYGVTFNSIHFCIKISSLIKISLFLKYSLK